MATTIDQSFIGLKQNLQITGLQIATVSTRQQGVRSVLEADLEVLDTFLTGSYSRSTMISPLSKADIDIFAVLNPQYFHQYNGQSGGQGSLLDMIKRTLQKTYTKTPKISRNGQAVTITFADFVVDVVPAFNRNGGGYVIPDAPNQVWIESDPKAHVAILTDANRAHSGDLVPLIKMIKAWNRANGAIFHSFHLEVLALQILDNIRIDSYSSGMRFYFDKAREVIRQKNLDPAGYGGDIGGYLNTALTIQAAVDKFQLAYDRSVRAEQQEQRGEIANAVEGWRKIFGDCFPAYG